MKNLRNIIIHLLGGKTDEELIKEAKEQAEIQNKIVGNLRNEIDYLSKQNIQLDKWLLAFTDAIHNFNRDSLDKEFNDLSSQRIRKVATTYRMLSLYCFPYQNIEDDLFIELQNFVFKELHKVFSTGNFSDDAFNIFEELEVKVAPFIKSRQEQKI